ncbi:MAG: alpha/beta fold hydrolase [Bacteroidota bacterium]
MPLISSPYQAKGFFKNGHFSTIYSAKLRPTPVLLQQKERLILPDNDFLDIEWSSAVSSSKKVAILLHGLEGNAQRVYMKGQGKILIENAWDVAAVNYRGCSGIPNKNYASYNAGKTDDLDSIVHSILNKGRYDEISLIGFSMGGNLLLKYLGEGRSVPQQIKTAIAISTPLNLKGSLERLEQWYNWVYRTTFLRGLKGKYKSKMRQFPEKMNMDDYKRIKSLLDFDDIYTAKAHGFKDALDYYQKNSSLQFIPNISIPTLILNAENDSFLSEDCYPRELASHSKNIYLETPKHGGHVGFHQSNKRYYSESRVLTFLNNNQ